MGGCPPRPHSVGRKDCGWTDGEGEQQKAWRKHNFEVQKMEASERTCWS